MRVPLALACAAALSLSLAGCGGPDGDGRFDGTCPSWVKGLSSAEFREGFQNSSVPDSKFDPARPTGAGLREFQGRPLDFVELDFNPKQAGQGSRPQAIGVANATLELRVFRSDGNGGVAEQLLIEGGGEAKDVWTWGPGIHANFTLRVPLAAPHEPVDTDPIVLRWDFLPDTNARTPSEAIMLYTAYFWYRQCGSDGTLATVPA